MLTISGAHGGSSLLNICHFSSFAIMQVNSSSLIFSSSRTLLLTKYSVNSPLPFSLQSSISSFTNTSLVLRSLLTSFLLKSDRNVTEESLDKATDTGEDNLVAVDNSVPAHEVHVGHWLAVPHQLRSSSPFCPAAPRGGDPRCYLVQWICGDIKIITDGGNASGTCYMPIIITCNKILLFLVSSLSIRIKIYDCLTGQLDGSCPNSASAHDS